MMPVLIMWYMFMLYFSDMGASDVRLLVFESIRKVVPDRCLDINGQRASKYKDFPLRSSEPPTFYIRACGSIVAGVHLDVDRLHVDRHFVSTTTFDTTILYTDPEWLPKFLTAVGRHTDARRVRQRERGTSFRKP